jgi:23S rRNA pseudouridine1911/1915/1917 synthase
MRNADKHKTHTSNLIAYMLETMSGISPIIKVFCVECSDQGSRLDKFLVQKMPDFSRTRLSQLITSGYVSVSGAIVTDPSYKTKEGQVVEITTPPLTEANPSPQAIPLDILFEDEDVIVINKPAGMVVHPAPGNPTGTLVNALLSHCGESLSGINGVKRPGIVHRLDKNTSGLLVAAKNDQAHHHLAHQLASRVMKRIYYAVVWGSPFPPQGLIEGAIARDPRHRQRMALRASGKFARTHYKTLISFGKLASLVECRLETGRTHQIRVHLASKGYPLVGDSLYGKQPRAVPSYLKIFLEAQWLKDRQALHAKELSFIHPRTHEELYFSTKLPEDMENLIIVLQSPSETTMEKTRGS